MISVSAKTKRPSTHEALEIVKDGVSRHWRVEYILQRTAGTHQKKRSLINDLNELANNILILAESTDI
jgi:hypothetical protein